MLLPQRFDPVIFVVSFLAVFIFSFDNTLEGPLIHQNPQMGLIRWPVSDNFVVGVKQLRLFLIALLGIEGLGALFEDGLKEAALVASA